MTNRLIMELIVYGGAGFILLFLFLACRVIVLWYFRINEIVDLLRQISVTLAQQPGTRPPTVPPQRKMVLPEFYPTARGDWFEVTTDADLPKRRFDDRATKRRCVIAPDGEYRMDNYRLVSSISLGNGMAEYVYEPK